MFQLQVTIAWPIHMWRIQMWHDLVTWYTQCVCCIVLFNHIGESYSRAKHPCIFLQWIRVNALPFFPLFLSAVLLLTLRQSLLLLCWLTDATATVFAIAPALLVIVDTATATVFAPAPQSLVHTVTAAAVFGPRKTTLPSPHPSNFFFNLRVVIKE